MFIIIILVGGFTIKLIFLPTNDCKNQVLPVAYIPVLCAQIPAPLHIKWIAFNFKKLNKITKHDIMWLTSTLVLFFILRHTFTVRKVRLFSYACKYLHQMKVHPNMLVVKLYEAIIFGRYWNMWEWERN